MKLYLLLSISAWLIAKYLGFYILFIFLSICIIIFYFKCFLHLIKVKRAKNHIYELMLKYDDKEIVSRILNQSIWVGQTASQLLDSLGNPEDTSEWCNTKEFGETWKYYQTGKNRYALKIYIVNNHVSGWDRK